MLVTPRIDRPALAAACERLHWTIADLARESGLSEERVRELVAGQVYCVADVRAIQLAVATASLARET